MLWGRMLVYMCLVVVALLVPAADSAICKFPDQYVITMQKYTEKVYYNFSVYNTDRMIDIRKYYLDRNKIPVDSERILSNYNVMKQYVIAANGTCSKLTLNKDILTGIPDNAVEVNIRSELPPFLPKGIRFWRFKWSGDDDIVLGVLNITSDVCGVLVYGKYNRDLRLITESLLYNLGEYSLKIWELSVFDVPYKCQL